MLMMEKLNIRMSLKKKFYVQYINITFTISIKSTKR